jgi:hypothetical protein
MGQIDADVLAARIEPDGRMTVKVTVRLASGDACVIKTVRLAEPTPAPGGGVNELATIADADIALGPGAAYEGSFTWPLEASKRARALGRVIVVFEPDSAPPLGIGFDFAPAPKPRPKRSILPLVSLALVAIGVAIALFSRAC